FRLQLSYCSPASQTLVIAVCETKHVDLLNALPNSASSKELPSFISYRKPFASNSAGLACFVRNTVPTLPRPDLEKSPHVLALQLTLPSTASPCILLTCYRHKAEGAAGWNRITES